MATIPFGLIGAHTSIVWLPVAMFIRGIGIGIGIGLGFSSIAHAGVRGRPAPHHTDTGRSPKRSPASIEASSSTRTTFPGRGWRPGPRRTF